MIYLIIYQDPQTGERSAFYTKWFNADNNFNPEYNMVVVNLVSGQVTFDGVTWELIEQDHL